MVDYSHLAQEEHFQALAFFLPEAPEEMLTIFDEVGPTGSQPVCTWYIVCRRGSLLRVEMITKWASIEQLNVADNGLIEIQYIVINGF